MNVFVISAAVIVFILSGVAAWMWVRVLQENLKQRQLQRELESLAKKKKEEINRSIQIIAHALLQGQVQVVEASIRISALLNQLSVDESRRNEYVAFDKLAEAVKHIPILEEWKALPKDKRRKFEVEMARLESEYEDFIRDSAKKIINQSF